MSNFNSYFLMKEEDVVLYVKEKTNIFDASANLTCKEIGDGNLNYVFHVADATSNRSVIVKQAGDTARISDEFKLSTNRIRIESDVLQLEGKLAPGLVPEVYLFDHVMNCCVMEDLSNHTILRTALIDYKTFPQLAEDISTFLVNTLLLTSDVVMNHKEKKDLVKSFINPELCEISEDLVYMEPFTDVNHRNEIFPLNKEWVEREIYGDKELRLEVAKLKFAFMTNAQALIHGDLHTGSIFVKHDSTKVIDPEFAFYGPIGYDVGNVVANLIFAWANGNAYRKEEFVKWVETTIVDVVDLFVRKFSEVWDANVSEPMAKELGFKEWYIECVLRDTAAVTGLELSRRIIGLAKVKDITSIENENTRMQVERICLTAAKTFIKNRDNFKSGTQMLAVVKDAQKMIQK